MSDINVLYSSKRWLDLNVTARIECLNMLLIYNVKILYFHTNFYVEFSIEFFLNFGFFKFICCFLEVRMRW